MQMPKTKYDMTKQCDVPRVADPHCTQDIFPMIGIDRAGTFELPGKRFSRQYVLSDINFAGMTDEEQKAVIINFSNVLKTMPCRFSYSVANGYVDERQMYGKVLYRAGSAEDATLAESLNGIIRDKVKNARQGLCQTIYLTLTVTAEDMADAAGTFQSMESALRNAFTGIGAGSSQGSVMKNAGTDQRMQMLADVMHFGIKNSFRFSCEKELAAGHDWLNAISPADICFENDRFFINGMAGRVYCVDEYPKSLESDMLSVLTRLNCISFVTLNSELLDMAGFKQEIARKYMTVGMKIENEKQRNRSNNDYLADASVKLLSEKEKLDDFQRQMDSGDDRYFNTTMLILVITESAEELDAVEEKLFNAAGLKSLKLKSCFGKQKEAFVSALPIGCQEFKRVTNLSSACLAMLMPFKTQELNDENGIYYGINRLSQNIIRADKKKLKNHNGIISGQSGSGKSVVGKVEMLGVHLAYPKDRSIVISPQNEYAQVAGALNGSIISFDTSKQNFLNPMDVNFRNVDYGRLREIIAYKSDFMLTLIAHCLRRDITAEEQGVIDAVVDRVYSQNYAMRRRLNGMKKEAPEFEVPGYMRNEDTAGFQTAELSDEEQTRRYSPTLQDIYQGLLDEGNATASGLAAAMEIFVNGSLDIFNHRTNVDLDNRFLVFDLSGLKENIRTAAMIVMMGTVREFIRNNSEEGVWTHLYIDEFHELLSDSCTVDFVTKLWKEIRKMKGIITGITQNVSDLLNNENGTRIQAVFSNTEYFAMLSQSTLDRNRLMELLPDISPAMFSFVDNAESGTGLLKMGNVCVPFDIRMDKDSEIYALVNTDGGGYGI